MTSERACGKMHLKASLERMGNLRFCVCARKRKPRLLVGTESNGAVYGSGLFCTSKYTGKDRKEGSESLREGGWGVGWGGGSAAGHLIVIVSPGSCGSARALFSFFCVLSSVPSSSAVISSSPAENAIDIRL